MYRTMPYESPLGTITLASRNDSLVGLWLDRQKYYGDTVPDETVRDDNVPILIQAKAWLDRYFAGEKPEIAELRLAPAGGEFRQAVWKILCRIPYGEVTTYGTIAKEMAALMGRKTMSSQAVGGAVGHNPISIIIPCHRVVGANGSLTGYAGGLDIKEKLLEFEGCLTASLFKPSQGTAL
ncbi:MAG: methylated-DNA--[protein]-cysteine S-methyltransferase [Planctomycetes bacterium]|nr:methylated-DNA--[protein]-cysteine S-methyltransferase [Planctomycetota bacterium]MCD7897285.1 methylated-DNA--[protein]-cysteine S-methyltransferase [Planctomycetaceae bacterium]